jgi:hypothetical protein
MSEESRATRYGARLALVSVLLGALMGGAVTGFATWLSLSAQREAQSAEFREERDAEQRALRTKAYTAFREAFDRYNLEASPLALCLEMSRREAMKVPACAGLAQSEAPRLLALRQAQDQIVMYGSDEANRVVTKYMQEVVNVSDSERTVQLESERQVLKVLLAQELSGQRDSRAAAMPGLRRNAKTLSAELRSIDLELAALRAAQQARAQDIRATIGAIRSDFQRVICSEINASPRPDC